MTARSRAVVAAALACVPLMLLSACGSTGGSAEGARSTLQYVPATNYVLREPATTTTTTTTTVPGGTDGARAEGEQTYVVKAGDGLFAIANRFDVEMQLICDYNGWSECGGDKLLLPGDEILIPPNAAVAGASTETADDAEDSIDTDEDGADEEAAAGEGCTYTIEAGDTPGGVASDYGITFDQLQAANPSRDFQTWFLVGASINIPPEGSC
jgi:LysM repeat protein